MPSNSHDNGRYDEPDPSPTLGRYWDEIVQEMPADPGDLDPSITATVRHLHTRDDAPGASTTFANRLWANLEDQMTTLPAPPLTIPHSHDPSPLLDHLQPRAKPNAFTRRAFWRPFRSATGYAVTFALIAAVFAVYLAIGPLRLLPLPNAELTRLAAIQAQSATPPPVSAALDIQIDLPAGVVPMHLEAGGIGPYTVPPGTDSKVVAGCCSGPRLTYILSGTLFVQSAADAQLLRHGSPAPWESIPAGTLLTLESSDALISRMDADFEARNESSSPVELIDGQLFAGNTNHDEVPAGWTYDTFDNFDNMYTPLTVPDVPMTLRLTQANLEAGATLALPPEAILQFAFSLDGGVTLGTQEGFIRRNLGKTPVALYVLTLAPTG